MNLAQIATGLAQGLDGKLRCAWCVGDSLYENYHDQEWGKEPVSDQDLFRNLCLEILQSGLSWLTILKKKRCIKC